MKTQIVGFILFLFLCVLVPLGVTSPRPYTISYSGPSHIPPGGSGTFTFTVKKDGIPQSGVTLYIFRRPQKNSSLSNDRPVTDTNGEAQTTLTLSSAASGTYLLDASAPDKEFDMGVDYVNFNIIVGDSPSASTPTSTTNTGPSSSGTTSPPPSPNLVKISDDNQVTTPDDSVILTIELRDSDGSPRSDVDLIFLILFGDRGDRSHASLSPTKATTDANGRAQTTLTFGTDAVGEYIVDVHRSDNPDVYTEFTVTVDPLLPKAMRLEKISGDNQTGLTGGVWAAPFVVEVRDQYDAPLAGTTVTFTVLTGGGRLSAETTTTDANGWAASTLRLGTESGINTVEVSAKGIPETVTFTAEAISPTLASVSGNTISDIHICIICDMIPIFTFQPIYPI